MKPVTQAHPGCAKETGIVVCYQLLTALAIVIKESSLETLRAQLA